MIWNRVAHGSILLKNPMSWEYMEKGERLFFSPRDTLLQCQEKQYQKLLIYAYEHTKYYRYIFDKISLVKNGKADPNWHKDIPILTKDIIRREGDSLVSDEAGRRGFYANTRERYELKSILKKVGASIISRFGRLQAILNLLLNGKKNFLNWMMIGSYDWSL